MGSGRARQTDQSFAGTARFSIVRRVGAGGMGVVYQCLDKERNELVALKTLRRVDGQAIYRLKQEFRALANVGHRNLVALHELMSVDDTWFFTMEFVDGKTLLEFLNGSSPLATMAVAETISGGDVTLTSAGHATAASRDSEAIAATPPQLTPAHLEKLRDVMRQLAEGVYALHHAGKLHRDVKPSNALVTHEGRVVLLDFGLVTELAPRKKEKDVVGTAAYMAPEQAAGQGATDASDWYAVGAVLYEALTGRVPFEGSVVDVLLAKQQRDAPPPREFNREVPADLDELCTLLLQRDPARRPSGREVMRLLGAHVSATFSTPEAPPAVEAPPLVGRATQLAALHEAFDATRQGRAVTVYVRGRSGMGKSALVERFLDEVELRRHALVLQGRCYERESVPYKALDSLVDALTAHLCQQKRVEVETVLPRHVDALARVFPVLERVDAVAFAPRRNSDELDPRELRQRAFFALRELLARLADRAPLVLYIDDLQWSDQDSAALLSHLVAPPDPPALLLICSQRDGLAPNLHAPPHLGRGPDVRTVDIGPLAGDEARALAAELLGPARVGDAELVADEAGGNPFFLHELARYYRESAPKERHVVRLSDVVSARFHRLSDGPRKLLELIAVAGRPIAEGVARRAAELGEEEHSALAILRGGQWVRAGDEDRIETFHDRIRETLVTMLTPDALRAHHRRLALALEGARVDDAEALAEHWSGAGDRARAAGYALRGAELADQALAFDRAAKLYQLALELRGDADDSLSDDARRVWSRLGAAQANAGRGLEAARAYRRAATGAPTAQALDLRQRAAGQLLMSGHIEEGLDATRELLAALGLAFAPTARRALVSLLRRRLLLRLRGLKFKQRQEHQIDESQLLRVDLCYAVAVGLGPVDSIRGADFQTLQTLLALRAGEPYRVARALAVEAGFVAMPGGKTHARAMRLLQAARRLSDQVEIPHADGVTQLMTGTAEYLVGHWRRGFQACQAAETIFRDRCIGAAWELTSAQRFGLSSLMYLGEIKDLARRVPTLLGAALEHDNLYGATDLRTRFTMVWLAADDPDGARARVDEALASWSRAGFHLQHYNALAAEVQIALYRGDGNAAWKHVQETWPRLMASMLMRIQVLRVEAFHLRARAALAAVAAGHDRAPLLAVARAAAKAIEKERMPWATPLATLIRAALASLDGDRQGAAQLVRAAAAAFEPAEMALHLAVARKRQGELDGGDGEIARAAEAWMAAQEIKRPDRIAAMMAPGFVVNE